MCAGGGATNDFLAVAAGHTPSILSPARMMRTAHVHAAHTAGPVSVGSNTNVVDQHTKQHQK